MNWKQVSKISALSAFAALALGLAACSSGVAQSEYDAVKTQVAQEQQKSASIQQQLSSKVQEAAQTQQQVTAKDADLVKLKDQVAAKDKEIADLKAKPVASTGLPEGGKILLASKPVPPPAPRATPTPVPAGYVPPPTPAPSASFYEPLKLVIHADTVTAGPGESKYNVDATGIANPSCVLTSVFKRGMHLVWRFEIVDAGTGKRLTDKDVDTAIVRLSTGEEMKGRFGRHGSTAEAPWFWTSAWDVPLDYPLGVLDWNIVVAAKDGKTGSFKLWNVSVPAVGVEARTQIME